MRCFRTVQISHWIIFLSIFQINHTLSTSDWHCGNKCIPVNTTQANQCEYVETCCSDTLEDVLINYLTLQYCTFNNVQPLGVIILCIFVFYAFLMLGNVADDYFAPTMAELADTLGVSHELAGVTFVAFGNGAPDISSSVAAITQGGDTIRLGLGALLGAAVFDVIAVSGVIALTVNKPEVARRPFLRDCFFLFVAGSCVLFITNDHKVVISEALGMVFIYVFYVLSVVLGELYKKLRTKKHRQTIERRKTHTEPLPPDITDKILPVLSAFSNDSMSNIFEPKIQTIAVNQMSPILQCIDDDELIETEVPYIQDLYQTLEEQERSQRRSKERSRPVVSHSSSLEDTSDALSDSDADEDEDQALWKVILLYTVRGPTLLLDILCKLSIPLTDDNWNDWTATISCTTAPIFIQFAFIPDTITQCIAHTIPIVVVVGVMGFILSAFTYWRIRLKYISAEEQNVLEKPLLDNREEDQGQIHSEMCNVTESLVGGGTEDNRSECMDANVDPLLGSNIVKSEYEGMDELLKVKKHVTFKTEDDSMSEVKKQAVMKMFFLMLGFLSAVAWIKVVAEQLVNLITTLGVISTIDLALLGLTVLAWGNSIGDMIADVSVARKGYAKMGISAAIAGPTLNVLIGVGLGTTIETLKSGGKMIMPNTSNIFVCCVAVMGGIAIYATWTAINRWTLSKAFGYFCFVYYFGFLVTNVLVYKRVISLPFGS